MVKVRKFLSPRSRAVRRADAARDRAEPATAARLYKLIIDTWGANFGVLVQLGNALKDSDAFEDAERAYRSALEMRPLDADCHLQLGHLMKLAGRLNEAKDCYVEANRLDPALPGALEELQTIKKREEFVSASALNSVAIPEVVAASEAGLPHKHLHNNDSRPSLINERIHNNLRWRRN